MKKNAWNYVKKCDKCQRFAPVSHSPAQPLTLFISPWLFAIWGIIVGKIPLARGKLKCVVVAVDYFTKYVEAKALAMITTNKIIRFVYQTIFCRYGVPAKII